jgi:hypothetical protein
MTGYARLLAFAAPIFQLPFLWLAARENKHLLSQDAISFILFARYYEHRQFDLAICGAWGPLLSWLLAPLLPLFDDPLVAARIAMSLSALIFLLGTIRLLRCLELTPAWVVLGAWVTAVATIYWSVMVITPDLMFDGIVFLTIAEMLSPRWIQGAGSPILAGMLAGASYLAKPLGFAMSIVLILVIAALWMVTRSGNRAAVLRSARLTLIAFLLIATPWVVTLSVKYHRLTIYSAAGIAHALVGPPDMYRGYPVVLRKPEPGRRYWAEDMTDMLPSFRTWSPFESRYYAKHQVKVILANAERMIGFLAGFDTLHLGLAAVILGLLQVPWSVNLRAQRWRWSGVLVACTCGIYLPVYGEDFRYYLLAYPFIFAAAAGMVMFLTSNASGRWNLPCLIGSGLLAFSFLDAQRDSVTQALHGVKEPLSTYATDLAGRLRATGIRGPVAGAGELADPWIGEAVAYFVAFLLDEPFYGSDPEPRPEHFKKSGAKLLVINRQAPVVADLNRDPDFVGLDSVLFSSQEQADRYPLKVFEQREADR